MIVKITPANLCKPIHDIINYSTSICPFESGKCGKEGENYKNLNIWSTKRASQMKCLKTFSIVLEGLSFGEKIIIWQKIADASLKTDNLILSKCYQTLDGNSLQCLHPQGKV